jgi:hypothetical protein
VVAEHARIEHVLAAVLALLDEEFALRQRLLVQL